MRFWLILRRLGGFDNCMDLLSFTFDEPMEYGGSSHIRAILSPDLFIKRFKRGNHTQELFFFLPTKLPVNLCRVNNGP